ncbi:MAG: hypothetical protein KC421_25505, partial [Anaerolineales bacterium]|nr:hypothetical protein [Anaerolineales bacterium]
AALQYLEAAFDQAVLAIAAVPEPDQPPLQERLRLLTQRAVALIGTLEIADSEGRGTAVSALIGKLETLLLILKESGDNPVEIADV